MSEIIKDNMPDTELLFELADLFKVFGDSTRIRIICALFEAELPVYGISELLGLEQSTVSHQLRILRQNKLVKVRKDGKQSFYSLSDEHVRKIFDMGLSHIME
ncbi:MAG: metalloregulator ArsR/SmtB family transcription factor [Oscillospiraceae bacterium]|jgi:DNA-binding transcriptional ArsR family regulator|nr:metalloregulator ArsR/SmtB family transcription factor [Oscillospiraceae bacterium]